MSDSSGVTGSEGDGLVSSLKCEGTIKHQMDDFVRLKRLRKYDQAHEIFQQTLSKHISLFPVVVEYADLLLEQGKYRILDDFLDTQIKRAEGLLEDVEIELLQIMRSLVRIHTKGALRSALRQATKTWDFLRRQNISILPGKLPCEISIRIFEIYIAIIVFASRTSNWVGLEEMRCPWIFTGSTPATSGRCGFVQWFDILSRNDDLWNSYRVLHILLKVLPTLSTADTAALLNGGCFGGAVGQESFSLMSEMKQAVAFNACIDRAEALGELTVTFHDQYQSSSQFHDMSNSQDRPWRHSFHLARQFMNMATSCPLILSYNGGKNMHCLRLRMLRMRLDMLETVFSNPENVQHPKISFLGFDGFPQRMTHEHPESFISGQLLSQYSPSFSGSDKDGWRLDFGSVIRFQLDVQADLGGFVRLCTLLYGYGDIDQTTFYDRTPAYNRIDRVLTYHKPLQLEYGINWEIREAMQSLQPVMKIQSKVLDDSILDWAHDPDPEEFDVPSYLLSILGFQPSGPKNTLLYYKAPPSLSKSRDKQFSVLREEIKKHLPIFDYDYLDNTASYLRESSGLNSLSRAISQFRYLPDPPSASRIKEIALHRRKATRGRTMTRGAGRSGHKASASTSSEASSHLTYESSLFSNQSYNTRIDGYFDTPFGAAELQGSLIRTQPQASPMPQPFKSSTIQELKGSPVPEKSRSIRTEVRFRSPLTDTIKSDIKSSSIEEDSSSIRLDGPFDPETFLSALEASTITDEDE